MRKIIHIDMDAFYAAVEQRDDPSLRGLPVAVGGGGPRGVVMTASYEARPFGVRSAMPGATARRLCPELVFVKPRFETYKAASRAVHAVLQRHTELVETLSLDEAFLDVTVPLGGPAPAVKIARSIKRAIHDETGLTASAGVSFNKFLAKIASNVNKPDGLTVIRPEQALAFIASLPIERFHGVGPATARRMRARGIGTGADLQRLSLVELTAICGSSGMHYHSIARARDDRPVRPFRQRKSLSVERTFDRDVVGREAIIAAMRPLATELAARLERSGFRGRCLTLKIKLANFHILTRSSSHVRALVEEAEIAAEAERLLARALPLGPVRLLGLGVGGEPDDLELRQLQLALTESGRSAW